MDYLSADSLPWLGQPQRIVREALQAGRLPHATLLLSAPGLGAEMLAHWVAAVALCGAAQGRPCGTCASCTLLRTGSHPDLHVVRLEQDAKQIKVDQVRELIGELTLKSYRGGYKVGIIEAAETLNANGANAFLKTLEEPAGMALLVLVARPTHRLPATVASRCMKLILRPPPAEDAISWLGSQDGGAEQRWDAALALAGGAPLLALQLGTAGAASLGAEMDEDLRSIGAGRVDLTLLADRWTKGDLGLRLTWLENWITRRVHAQLGGAESNQTAERARLPGPLLKVKIRALFDLLDGARELRRLASTGVNQQLALEALLIGGGAALK